MSQVLRTYPLIKNKYLLDKILEHGSGKRPSSKFVKGDKEKLAHLKDKFTPSKWLYEVVIVQPGLDCKKAAMRKNTKILLLTCYEQLQHIGAKFKIMGNYIR